MCKAIDAIDYWSLVSVVQPNGWGQHIHPDYGQSHKCLAIYQRKHGKAAFDKALDILFGKESR